QSAAEGQQMALRAKASMLQTLAQKYPQKSALECFVMWKTNIEGSLAAALAAANAIAKSYGGLIDQLRANAPRIEPKAVEFAVEMFRSRVGSNTLPLPVGDLNPAGVTEEERVDSSLLTEANANCDWNALLDSGWCTSVLLKPG